MLLQRLPLHLPPLEHLLLCNSSRWLSLPVVVKLHKPPQLLQHHSLLLPTLGNYWQQVATLFFNVGLQSSGQMFKQHWTLHIFFLSTGFLSQNLLLPVDGQQELDEVSQSVLPIRTGLGWLSRKFLFLTENGEVRGKRHGDPHLPRQVGCVQLPPM